MRILVSLLVVLAISYGMLQLADHRQQEVVQQERHQQQAQLHIEVLNGCEYVVQTTSYSYAVTASYPAIAQPATCKNDRIQQPAKK